MKKMLQKGFTLIELLVVITIIGILATGAVTVYTSQMTKARDSTRLSDVKALQGAIEQSYLENYVYPNIGSGFTTDITAYMARLPSDPRSSSLSGSGSALDYLYVATNDASTATTNRQRYELSVAFEGISGVPSATADSGNDVLRHEVGVKNTTAIVLSTARTVAIANTITSGECVGATGAAVACSGTNSTVIR